MLIDWMSMGLRAVEMVGWSFSLSPVTRFNDDGDEVEETGLLVRAPVTVHVNHGQVTFSIPPDAPQIERDWSKAVRIENDRLVFYLPIAPLPNYQVQLMSPPPGLGKALREHAYVISATHFDSGMLIRVVCGMLRNDFTIEAGEPICLLHPMPYSERDARTAQTEQQSSMSMAGAGQVQTTSFNPMRQPPQQQTPPVIERHSLAMGAVQPQVVETYQPQGNGDGDGGMPDKCPVDHKAMMADRPQVEEMSMGEDFTLRVWRLHPHGVRIQPAEKTLRGDAPQGAVRWCGPFTHANQYGFWLFPPVDMDIVWYGGRTFDYKILTPYEDLDYEVVRALQKPEDKYQFGPRHKIDIGGVLDPIVSIWTGCIFQTPPGWSLMIRSPINVIGSNIFRIQEGVLETDWLPYDIWMNLQFVQMDKWAHIRRDCTWPPIAQLIPVRREGYDKKWNLIDGPLERNTPEGEDIYQRWMDYNYKKWIVQARKEPSTYHRERARHIRGAEPYASERERD